MTAASGPAPGAQATGHGASQPAHAGAATSARAPGADARDARYLRHRQIDGFDQDAVSASRVAVVGAGAIGNEVVKNLVLLGIGRIDVYDFDRVEPHNLTRSVLLREADIGAPKADSVARRARELDPGIDVRAIAGDVRDTLGLQALRGYRAVIGALDNFEARLAVNQACLVAGVDWVNAAIDARHVSVETFPFGSGEAGPMACYECGLPESVYARLAQRQSCGGLLRAAQAQGVVPTTTITASLAGAYATAQMLRPPRAPQRWLMDTASGRVTVAAPRRADGCPCCANRPRAAHVQPYQAARIGDDDTIELAERLVLRCACPTCGASDAMRATLGRRASAVSDAVLRCPSCGQWSVDVETGDRIDGATLGRLVRHGAPGLSWGCCGDRAIDFTAPPPSFFPASTSLPGATT